MKNSEIKNKTSGSRGKGVVFLWIGVCLIVAAVLYTGWLVIDARRVSRSTQNVKAELQPLFEEAVEKAREERSEAYAAAELTQAVELFGDAGNMTEVYVPDYLLDPTMEMPVITSDGNDYIGMLSIPDIGLELPVMSDWDYVKMKICPCRYSGSAYLNDLIICAHYYEEHFGKLRTLPVGAEVSFTDADGNVFLYRVSEVETLTPTDFEAMEGGDWDLTLFTCTLSTTSRFTVRCERVR